MGKIIISITALLLLGASGYIFFGGETSDQSTKIGTTEDANTSAKPEIVYTTTDVKTHDTISDCWTIIDDIVYDITEFIAGHPGGEVIATICGKDGTEDFKNQGAPQELADNIREENNLPSDAEFHSFNNSVIILIGR